MLTYRDIIIGKPLVGPVPISNENNEDDDDTVAQPADEGDGVEEEESEVEDGGDEASPKDKGLCLF